MKKRLRFLLPLLYCSFVFSQVGIGTDNPQGIFHVDGKQDNDSSVAPTDAEQANDFIVDSNGNVGVGTVTPQGKVDVKSSSLGFIPPRMTTDQRDAIEAGYRPPGTLIYNTDLPNLQINLGTDTDPVWATVSTTVSSLYTMAVFSMPSAAGTGTGTQKISSTRKNILFYKTVFDNTPSGYVSLGSDSATVSLAKGKHYRIDFNVGRTTSDDSNYSSCYIIDGDGTSIASMSLLPSTYSSTDVLYNWNAINTMQAFVDTTTAATTINIACNKSSSTGNVWFNSGIAPVLSVTIID